MTATFYFVLGGLIAAAGLAVILGGKAFGDPPFSLSALPFWGAVAVGAVIAAAPLLLQCG